MSELTEAIKAGDAQRVAALLEADPSLLQSVENGVTPVLLAIYHGKLEVAQQLAARTPSLSFAEVVALGDREKAREMLDREPGLLHARSSDGFPAAALAIFFRHPELARELIERGADVDAAAENAQKVTALHAAAALCDRENARLLLERGANPDARQQMDYTPLHGAASRGDIALAQLLLDHGARRDAQGSDGATPADVARKYGHPEFAEWIEGGPA